MVRSRSILEARKPQRRVAYRPILEGLEDRCLLSAVETFAGFDANTLGHTDDGTTGSVPLGFATPLQFAGVSFDQVYVNNNGNVTINRPRNDFQGIDFNSETMYTIFGPFVADVNTSDYRANPVTFGSGTLHGHDAFAATWPGVPGYGRPLDQLNAFQIVIIDRADTGAGNFDVEYNYDQVQWDAGVGESAAFIGFSAGTHEANTDLAFAGSGVAGTFLDSNPSTGLIYNSHNSDVPGRYLFSFRGGLLTEDVGPVATTTTVDSSAHPAVWGQALTLTATVASAGSNTPTGTVTFLDGGTTLGTGTLQVVGGLNQATFTTSALEVGGHTITALYSGDANFLASTSADLNQVVTKATPAVAWANAADITYGAALGAEQLDATASVAGSFAYTPAAGTVLHAGVNQSLNAVFTPTDAAHYNAVPVSASIHVLPAALTVTAAAQAKVYGAPRPALTASYAGFVNGDTVAVLSGAPALSTTATQFSVPGNYDITAGPGTLRAADYFFQFVGNTLTISPAATSAAVTASAATPLFGTDLVTFTAQVAVVAPGSGSPSGTVTFSDAGTFLGTAPVADGQATFSTGALSVGTHTITASYSGDGNFLGSSATVAPRVLAPASLSGLVYNDFNNNGEVDFGEPGIPNVPVHLTGTDDLGQAVDRTLSTDLDGVYQFFNLRPGAYAFQETQPAGYIPGVNSVGTLGGSLGATDQFFVAVTEGVNGLHYNYGERPLATGAIQAGQTAGVGFWHNNNGQALIRSLNGGSDDTHLATWLAVSFPHIFGADAGAHNLTGKTNADVAALFQQDFQVKAIKVDAQVLATALAVYVTDSNLDTTSVGSAYGFIVSGNGVGTATFNVGSSGAAFGVDNNSTLTIMDLLLAADGQAVNGVLYNGNATLRNQANSVFAAINDAGKI